MRSVELSSRSPVSEIDFLGDAGLGLRADHRIGDTRFTTRFDFPLYVSRPELAQDRDDRRRRGRISLDLQL